VNIQSSLNKGSSDYVKSNFTNIEPVSREIIETTEIVDPNWITGFVTGEGNFDAGIRKATIDKSVFRVTQNDRDIKLMELIIKYMEAGRIGVDKRKGNSTVSIVVGNFLDITDIEKYQILGVKKLDYLD